MIGTVRTWMVAVQRWQLGKVVKVVKRLDGAFPMVDGAYEFVASFAIALMVVVLVVRVVWWIVADLLEELA